MKMNFSSPIENNKAASNQKRLYCLCDPVWIRTKDLPDFSRDALSN